SLFVKRALILGRGGVLSSPNAAHFKVLLPALNLNRIPEPSSASGKGKGQVQVQGAESPARRRECGVDLATQPLRRCAQQTPPAPRVARGLRAPTSAVRTRSPRSGRAQPGPRAGRR